MRPFIGIGPVKRHVIGRSTLLIGCFHGYADAIEKAGGTYVVLPCSEDEEVLRAAFDRVDGVLLPGGSDIDPAFYGEATHPKTVIGPRERDVSDLAYARWALAQGKPFLGICRGMQVLNVAAGGTLHQHIPDIVGNDVHQEPKDGTDDSYAYRLVHDVQLTAESRVARLFEATEFMVNSAHHQAVDKVGAGLTVTGRCSDGIVELIEGSKGWCVGIECHPELVVKEADPRWRLVFSDFVRAAKDPMQAS